jgi:hypothetical protein
MSIAIIKLAVKLCCGLRLVNREFGIPEEMAMQLSTDLLKSSPVSMEQVRVNFVCSRRGERMGCPPLSGFGRMIRRSGAGRGHRADCQKQGPNF